MINDYLIEFVCDGCGKTEVIAIGLPRIDDTQIAEGDLELRGWQINEQEHYCPSCPILVPTD